MGTQLGTGMSAGTGMEGTAVVGTLREEDKDTSALGEDFDCTPLVIPTRAHLDAVKRLLKGELYIGRGSKQRSLPMSRCCNNYKVAEYGRDVAVAKFREMLLRDEHLYRSLWALSGRRLICHCRATERCHADVAGHRGAGEPMKVGVGYTQREFYPLHLLDAGLSDPVSIRRPPSGRMWLNIMAEQLLASLAMGKVETFLKRK